MCGLRKGVDFRVSDRFRQIYAVELNSMGVVALSLGMAVSLAQDAVELVDEEIDGLVAVVALRRGIDIRSVNNNMSLRHKLVVNVVF